MEHVILLGNSIFNKENAYLSIQNRTATVRPLPTGVPHLETADVIAELSRSVIGRTIAEAAANDIIHLEISIHAAPPAILGANPIGSNVGVAFAINTQTVEQTAATLVHEGLHASGLGGSQTAEFLVRLAVEEHRGQQITAQLVQDIWMEMGRTGAYHHLPMSLGQTYEFYPGRIVQF